MPRLEIDQNSNAVAGKTYALTLEVDLPILEDEIAQVLSGAIDIIGSIAGTSISYFQDKTFRIVSSKKITGKPQIEVIVFVESNPAPIAGIVIAVLAVLGVFGAWLALSKVEEIIEDSPSIGIGIALVLGALAYFGFKKI